MSFILPKVPSFGENFANALTQGLGKGLDTANTIMTARAKKGPSLSESLQKLRGKPQKGFSSKFTGQEDQESQEERSLFEGLSDQEHAYLAEAHPKAYKALSSREESRTKNKGLRDTFNRLDTLTEEFSRPDPFSKNVHASNLPGSEFREGSEELNTSGLLAADAVYTHFNKGTVSDSKLKLIQEKFAPNSRFTKRQNRARNASMRRILNMAPNTDPAVLDKVLEREAKKLGKAKPDLESFYE